MLRESATASRLHPQHQGSGLAYPGYPKVWTYPHIIYIAPNVDLGNPRLGGAMLHFGLICDLIQGVWNRTVARDWSSGLLALYNRSQKELGQFWSPWCLHDIDRFYFELLGIIECMWGRKDTCRSYLVHPCKFSLVKASRIRWMYDLTLGGAANSMLQ